MFTLFRFLRIVILVVLVTGHAEAQIVDAELHLVAFRAADAGPLADLNVSIGNESGVTNEDGVLRRTVLSGTVDVCMEHESFTSSAICIPVRFSQAQTSLLLVTIDATGRLVTHAKEEPNDIQPPSIGSNQGPAQMQRLTVRVLSEETGVLIAGARIFVVGHDIETVSNDAGVAMVELPVSTHTLSVIHTAYSTKMRRGVVVNAAGGNQVEVRLGPLSLALDDFVVTIPRISGSVAKILEDRRKASSVQDGLGAEELARSPDGSASSASRRIVGASVIGGQFLVVRGLGGRYTSVRLNDVPLPSTDPDMPGVQMDLFPSSLLSSLTIEKTFRADLPANFAGGTMNIETKAFPEAFTLTASISTSFDTVSTGRMGLTYPGSSTDWLGFDDGRRALPNAVPNRRVTPVGLRALPQEQVTVIGQSFETNWATQRHRIGPPINLGVSLGDTLKRRGWQYGYLVTGGYKYKERLSKEIRQTFNLKQVDGQTEIEARERMHQETGRRTALFGGLASLSVMGPKKDTYKLISLLTKTMTDETSALTGKAEQEDAPIRMTQMQFIERRLWLNQLIGHHPNLGDALELDWRLNLSKAARGQPDSRSLLYIQRQSGADYSYRDSTGSGVRLFTELDQTDYGAAVDVLYRPVQFKRNALQLKLGSAFSLGERAFGARRFGVRFTGTAQDRLLPSNQLFDAAGFGDRFQFRELTRADDGYLAELALMSNYTSLDVELGDSVRLIGGVRVERAVQRIQAKSPYATSSRTAAAGRKLYLDPLPAASLVVTLSETQTLRLVYGGTVARPLVREFAPFLSQDFVRGRGVQGNPDLLRTYIHNYDLRWERFFSTTEVFAFSAFYKTFLHPIERVIIDTNGNIRYANVDGAINYGLEFELRYSLGRFNRQLESFELGANLALIVSNVRLSAAQKSAATSGERPLAGQSPYVANCSLSFKPSDTDLSLNVYYNVFGQRIVEVGLGGLPDTLEEPFHALDVAASWQFHEQWSLSMNAKNLLFQPKLITQGGQLSQRAQQGLSTGLKLGYRY
jgi:hypothetical protein